MVSGQQVKVQVRQKNDEEVEEEENPPRESRSTRKGSDPSSWGVCGTRPMSPSSDI